MWILLIIATVWAIAIFHDMFDLSLSHDKWYAFPLLVTYFIVIIASIFIAVSKMTK
jgi:hypothetical protein